MRDTSNLRRRYYLNQPPDGGWSRYFWRGVAITWGVALFRPPDNGAALQGMASPG